VIALACFLVSFTLGDLAGNIFGTNRTLMMYVAVALSLLWFAVAAFRLLRWPCPRCGRPFLASQDPWERRCGNCALGLYEDL
jgi:ribosomal protein S27AE